MKKFFGLLFLAVGLTSAPVYAGNTLDDHAALWEAVERVGVSVTINDPTECWESADGLYQSYEGKLLVCQDGAQKPFVVSAWSANDLDTLRHEAHHVLQDCVEGRLGDGRLGRALTDDEVMMLGMTRERMEAIETGYRQQGASDYTISLEIEAFAVASGVDASVLARELTRVCGVL